MLDPYRIKTRIKEIDNRLQILERDFRPLSEEELTKNEDKNAAAERHLQVAVQACIDIANHIISVFGLGTVDQAVSEVFTILSREEIIPEELAKRLSGATGYRNVLVHDYIRVDRNKTYENIQNHLPDLSEFAKYIEEFLEKQEKKKAS